MLVHAQQKNIKVTQTFTLSEHSKVKRVDQIKVGRVGSRGGASCLAFAETYYYPFSVRTSIAIQWAGNACLQILVLLLDHLPDQV